MMENDRPLVEILLATYNGEKYLSELIDSLLEQSYRNILITISDDSSTDGTMGIIRKYKDEYPGLFRLLPHTDRFGNAKDNFFFLLRNSVADYVFLCDQDDVWLPEKVEIMIDELQKHDNEPSLVHCDLEVVDNNLALINSSFVKYSHLSPENDSIFSLTFINTVTGCASCINRKLINLCLSNLNDTSEIIMHDYWLGLIAASFGYIGYIDKPLVKYRQHGDNSIGAEQYKSFEFANKIIDRKKQMLLMKKMQSSKFINLYLGFLSPKQKIFLADFSKRRSGLMFWVSHFKYIRGLKNKIGFLFLG